MQLKFALAGNPNAGKTTLFNQLTGARQHVGNYPGITVSYKEGHLEYQGQKIIVTDLPGTYSMTAYSSEELVARDYLVQNRPNVVINIVDASNLERNLYLTCQLMELGVPLVIALNMIDVAEARGIAIQTELLSKLLQIPIVPIIARSGYGKEELLGAALQVACTQENWRPLHISYGEDIDSSVQKLTEHIIGHGIMTDLYPARYTAIKYLENDEQLVNKVRQFFPQIALHLEQLVERTVAHTQRTLEVYPEAIIADHRYGYIKSILRQGVVARKFDTDRLYTSDKIDKILTNRLLGPVIMLGVLFALYHFTFNWSELPVTWCKAGFSFLADMVESHLPDGVLKSLLISGVIGGVGGVLGFVPLIMFMFFGIAILEDSGYLARVAFMMDRIFRIFGLHGSSVMPFIVSGGIAGGCAVPGVMATRTLRSPKERMATLLTVPLMNCGAKLPVLALLIGTFFSDKKAAYMFFCTMLAWLVAMLSAKLLRSTVLKGDPTPFVMELPPYRFPTMRGLLIHTWERTYQYIKKAGTVILAISIVIWAMMTFPRLPEDVAVTFQQQRQNVISTHDAKKSDSDNVQATISKEGEETLESELMAINNQEAEVALRHSFAGQVGTNLESISKLAGFDWRTDIALIGGFAAKEVIISTLGTAYSMGKVDSKETDSLSDRLKADQNWNKVVAISALIFIMFYSPCFVTLICIAREASWKWAFFSMAYNTILAFVLAVSVYQTGIFFRLT